MVTKKDKNAQRLKRHRRVRGKISGTAERPRLAVYRSNANIYAQIIDDVKGVTLCSAGIAVSTSVFGILLSIVIDTPVGATIVGVQALVFAVFFVIGKLAKR